MSIEVKVPMLPESISEASMLSWHKKVGDSVTEGEILVDLETDKVVLEVPATQSGVLEKILKHAGDVVTANEILAVINESGTAAASTPAPAQAAPAPEATTQAAPVAAPNASSATIDINTPVLPESVSEATIQVWHKKVGEFVNEGENLMDLETDKVVLEVPATSSGVLTSINAEAGSVVTANQLLAVLSASAAPAASSNAPVAAAPQASDGKDPASSPSARRMMDDNDLTKADVQGSGHNDRITKKDVINTVNTHTPAPAATSAPSNTSTQATNAKGDDNSGRKETREPMTRIRQTIARRLVESQQNTAMLTTFNEVDLTEVMALRTKHKDDFIKAHDVKLGFMSFFVKASIEGLKKFPAINAYVDGTDILYHNYCDVGIAVSSPRGLVVPVVRNCEHKSFADIEGDIVGYGEKAKKGTLSMDEMTGGTFTITNGGIFGSLISTPIINPPQSAILGMHTIKQRAVVIDGEIVARPMMYLALSYDHRIVDGAEAVQFLVTVKDCLENPSKMLLAV